jgi:hypothetical protein
MTEPNIVQFPKNKIVRETVPDIDELNKVKEKSIMNFADGVVEDMSSNILFELGNYGIDIESEKFLKDFYFLVAIMGATIYRTLSVEHPLQAFMDEKVVIAKIEGLEDIDDIINSKGTIIGAMTNDISDKTVDNPD